MNNIPNRWLQYQGPEVPRYLQKLILMRGGSSPFGEPRYRLVWAPKRFEQCFGVWHDWDENLGVNDRNYVDKSGKDLNHPIRVVEEMRWVPKYPSNLDKWLLERWSPASAYGTPLQWFSPIEQGGTCKWSPGLQKSIPLLGDYPWYGDYEDTGYAFPPSALTEGIMMNAIGRIEHYIDNLPSTPEGRTKRALYLQAKRNDEREQKYDRYASEIVGDSGFAFHGASFAGYGEKHKSDIEATADKLGISMLNVR